MGEIFICGRWSIFSRIAEVGSGVFKGDSISGAAHAVHGSFVRDFMLCNSKSIRAR